MELGIFQKDALVEKLAKAFYAIQGYVVSPDYRMQSATHPHEKACVEMAFTAIEEVHIYIPDGISVDAIKQYINDRYNSGELTPDLNIFQVDFEAINATMVSDENSTEGNAA